MSEDVRIVQFGSMPDYQLPDWATEKTLDKIRGSLEKDLDLTEDTKRVLNNIFEEIKKTKTISSQQLKEMTSASGANGKFSKTAKGLDELRDSTSYVTDGTRELGRATKQTAKTMGDSLKWLVAGKMAFLPAFYALQRHGRMMIAEYTNSTQMFRTLYGRGIELSGTVVDLRTNLAASGTSMEQFGTLMEKYGKAVYRTGTDRFYRMNREMERLGDSIRESRFILADYGLTHQEAAEFQGAYLEQQRMMGGLRVIDERKLRAGMQEQIKSLSALTKLTNKSREEILQDQMKMLDDSDVVRMLQSMPASQAEAVKTALVASTGATSALGLENMDKYLIDMVASVSAEGSESFRQLAEAGQIEAARFIASLSRDIRSGRIASTEEAILRFVNGLQPEISATLKSGRQEMFAMVPELRSAANEIGVWNRELTWASDNISKYLGPDGQLDLEAMAKAKNAELKAYTGLTNQVNQARETVILSQLKMLEDVLGDPQIGLTARMQQFTDVLGVGVDAMEKIFNISAGGPKEEMSMLAKIGVGTAAGLGLIGVGKIVELFVGRMRHFMVPSSMGMGMQGDLFDGAAPTRRPRSGGRRAMGRMGMMGGLGAAAFGTGMLTDYMINTASSESSARGANLVGGIAQGALGGASIGALGGPVGMAIGALIGGIGGGLMANSQNQGQLRQSGEIPTGVDRRANEQFIDEAQKSQINMTRNIEKSNEQLTAMNRNIQRLYEEVATIKSLYRAEVASGGGLAKTQG